MEKSIIPVVFAANDKYAPYLGVALHSLIRHAAPENIYKIYILTEGFSDSHSARILSLERENVRIEFRDVSKLMAQWNISTVNHLSKETTYRLLIDKLFPEFEKILYLDSDIVICKDVAILYYTDIQNCVLGASRAFLVRGTANYIERQLRFPIIDYFNAGVLLINVEKFASQNIGGRGLDMLASKGRTYMTQDQDVLNLLCHRHVYYFDGRWNVEWEYLTGKELVMTEYRENQKEYFDSPYIVHYTSPVKPWAHPEIQKAEYFWREAQETVFYEEILLQNSFLPVAPRADSVPDSFARYIFPWQSVKPGSRIVIYGGGVVGKIFCQQIEKTQYCKIIAVCDKAPEKVKGLSLPLISPLDLSKWDLADIDTILIAIEDNMIASDIHENLLKIGIPEDKMSWKSPLRT